MSTFSLVFTALTIICNLVAIFFLSRALRLHKEWQALRDREDDAEARAREEIADIVAGMTPRVQFTVGDVATDSEVRAIIARNRQHGGRT